MDGEIVEINPDLENNASLINQDAEKDGWIFKIRISKPSQIDSLMTQEQYKEFLKKV